MNTEEKIIKRLHLNKIGRDNYLKRKNEGRLTTLIPKEEQKPRGRPIKLDKKTHETGKIGRKFKTHWTIEEEPNIKVKYYIKKGKSNSINII